MGHFTLYFLNEFIQHLHKTIEQIHILKINTSFPRHPVLYTTLPLIVTICSVKQYWNTNQALVSIGMNDISFSDIFVFLSEQKHPVCDTFLAFYVCRSELPYLDWARNRTTLCRLLTLISFKVSSSQLSTLCFKHRMLKSSYYDYM